MRTTQLPIPGTTPGTHMHLTVHRFGQSGARPQIYIQGGLHADEAPGMIVAHVLREKLAELDGQGLIAGEIILVPAANPIGLAQRVLGTHVGRFDLADGANFNRHYPELGPKALESVGPHLSDNAAHNVTLIRTALRSVLHKEVPQTPSQHLKFMLMGLALDADIVLDLHCDSEGMMHLYTLTTQADVFVPLGAHLGAHAVLTAMVSGDHPFDEAMSGPWQHIAAAFPHKPIPLACASVTVELRGEADVDYALADTDAEAILAFVTGLKAINRPARPTPAPLCKPTPLAASEPMVAPIAGLIVFRKSIGDVLAAGDIVADIIDPVSGETASVCTSAGGIFYARTNVRFIGAGRRFGKVAGTVLVQTGKLLGP